MPADARSEIDTSPTTSSSGGFISDHALEFAKQCARLRGLRTACALGPCCRDERRECVVRRGRIRSDERLQAVRLVEEAIAPALDQREALALAPGSLAPCGERCADRRRVDISHQPADVLHLSPPRFMAIRPAR